MKKTKIYFSIFIILSLVALLFFYNKSVNGNKIYPKELIIVNLKNKISYYDDITDSTNNSLLRKNLEMTIQEISNINHEIKTIGERVKIVHDSIYIELFILSHEGKNNYISLIKNKNGAIERKDLKINFIVQELSLGCNSHYFYLPLINSDINTYDSYSLLEINNGNLTDVKIFFSNKFDSFINVRCMCTATDIKEIIEYLDKEFALIQ